MLKRRITQTFACFWLLGFLCGLTVSNAAIYYVATTGNNANTGSEQNPWRNIGYAAGRTVAGDTVRVQAGTYNERASLTADGTANAWINYVADGAVICRGFDLNGVNYTRIIGFEITHNNLSYRRGFTLSGTCSHVEILDNYIHDVNDSAIVNTGGTATHVVIRGNTIYYPGRVVGVATNVCCAIGSVYVTPQKWLIEYNHISRSGDYVNVYGANHIFRNNYFHDYRESYFNNPGAHSDHFQNGSDGVIVGSRNQIIERNFCGDSPERDAHFALWQDSQNAGDTNVLHRGNIVFNMGESGIGGFAVDKVMAIGNTFYDIGNVMLPSYGSCYMMYDRSGNYAYNCLVALNAIQLTSDRSGSPLTIASGSTGQKTHNSGFQTYTTGDSSFVVTSNPLFLNPASGIRNFHLQAGSPLRGAGTHLVSIISVAGTGTTFVVNDSQRLCDGFGIAEGDVVVIGSTTTRVVSNDWSANAITVADSVTWTQNQPVYWASSAKDLGALPYGSTDLTAASLLQDGTTYTVTTIGDARGVWFYTNGIPSHWDCDAPYQATFTSGTVTARAYALYAQANPVVTAGIGGNAPPSISFQPTSQTNVAGQSVTFTVTASGNPAPSYTWQTNNGSSSFVNVASGGNSPSWTMPALTIDMNGWNVRVALTNSQGYLLSDTVYIGVTSGAAPVISVQPQNATTTAGGAAGFTVVASGGALSYQWRLGGAAIPGATTSVYTTNNVTLAANGNQYSVVITNAWGVITSQVATLTVNDPVSDVWYIGNTWTTFALPNANDYVQFSFDAYVSHSDADFGIGFSPNVVDAWNDLGPIVLFDATGVIYARNAGVYMADTTTAYLPNTWYRISGTANILTHRYSVSVNGAPIATDYAFRTEQAGATQLSNFGATESYASVAIVSNLVWKPSIGSRPAAPVGVRVVIPGEP